CLSVKLYILGFFLANHDWVLQMDVDDNNELVLTWLEKEVLDIAEENINTVIGPERRLIAETILVNLQLSRDPLAVQPWTHKHFSKFERTAIANFDEIVLGNDILHLLPRLLLPNGILLHVRDLFADFRHSILVCALER